LVLFATSWIAAVIFFNPRGPIRFDSSVFEYFRWELFLLLPIPLAVAAAISSKGWLRVVLLVPTIGVSIVAFLLFLFCGLWFSPMLAGQDLCKLIKTVRVGQNQLAVYQVGIEGAAGRDSIELCQVWRIAPGVRLVRNLAAIYAQSDLDVTVLDDKKFKYVIEAYGRRPRHEISSSL
jgi:hypothetical protein